MSCAAKTYLIDHIVRKERRDWMGIRIIIVRVQKLKEQRLRDFYIAIRESSCNFVMSLKGRWLGTADDTRICRPTQGDNGVLLRFPPRLV